MLILDFLPVKYLSSVPRQWHCKKCSVTPFVVSGLGKYLSSFSEPLLRPNCKTLRIPHNDRSKNKAEGASSLFTVQYREVKRTGGRHSGGKMLLSFNTRLVMFMQRSRLSACQLSARLPWARCSPPLNMDAGHSESPRSGLLQAECDREPAALSPPVTVNISVTHSLFTSRVLSATPSYNWAAQPNVDFRISHWILQFSRPLPDSV